SYKKIHGRLYKLLENRYLKRIVLPLQKHIYAIGSAAVSVLVEQGVVSIELANERLRFHELKELFLKHEMMIVDIHTMLATANPGKVGLVAWKEGWRLRDHVDVVERGVRRRLPIYPDAFFTLQNGEGRAGQNGISFFLEADRSTTTHARFAEKIVAYWNYLQQGLHTKKYGIRAFRVVTITITAERARNLCTLAASVLPQQARRYFLFGSMESFSIAQPAGMLDPVFLTPRDASGAERVALIPKPQAQPLARARSGD